MTIPNWRRHELEEREAERDAKATARMGVLFGFEAEPAEEQTEAETVMLENQPDPAHRPPRLHAHLCVPCNLRWKHDEPGCDRRYMTPDCPTCRPAPEAA